jgi:hypothetical protein
MGNETKNVQSSVLLIKNVEKGRSGLTISHKVHEVEELNDTDCNFDHKTLNHLCGDLTEEEMGIPVTDHPSASKLHKFRRPGLIALEVAPVARENRILGGLAIFGDRRSTIGVQRRSGRLNGVYTAMRFECWMPCGGL